MNEIENHFQLELSRGDCFLREGTLPNGGIKDQDTEQRFLP
jgi:hypothetical protein